MTVVRTRLTSVLCRTLGSIAPCGEHQVWRTASRTPDLEEPLWHPAGGSTPGTRAPGPTRPARPTACTHGLPPRLPLSRRSAHPAQARPFPRPDLRRSARAHPPLPEDPRCPGCGTKVPMRPTVTLLQPQVETVPGPNPGAWPLS